MNEILTLDNIWEEKNLTEPEKKLEISGISEAKDIINEIKSESVKKECGDIGKIKKRKIRRYKNLEVGDKYGFWEIISNPFRKLVNSDKSIKYTFVKVKCVCGIEKEVNSDVIKKGKSKSCGCQTAYLLRCINLKHGYSGTKLYSTWFGMLKRCNNPNISNYYLYGEKGIKVCKEWENFSNFKRWADNNGYKEGLSIDRTNPYLGYSSENCKWVTKSQNSKNVTKWRDEKIKQLEEENVLLKEKLLRSSIAHEHHSTFQYDILLLEDYLNLFHV